MLTKEGWQELSFNDDQFSNPNLSLRITYKTDAGYDNWGYGAVYVYSGSDWSMKNELKVASASAGTYSDTIPLQSLQSDNNRVVVNFWGSYKPGEETIKYATLEKVELIETVVTGGTTTVTENASYDTQTLNSSNNWQHTWYNLDSTSEDGSIFTYYVKEVQVKNGAGYDITHKFSVSYDGATAEDPIGVSGSITITNTLKSTYVLPETGGAGIGFYRIGGSLLMGVAAAGLIGNTKRKKRKEADKTS